MKHFKKILTLACIASLLVAFTGCNKDDDPSSGSASVIEAKSVTGDCSDVATVKAMYYDPYGGEDEEEYFAEIASANFKNGGFKLNLPTNVSDVIFVYPQWYWLTSSKYSSDRGARLSNVYVMAYNSAKEIIGEFYHGNDDDDYGCHVYYMYADRKFTVKGEGGDDMDADYYDCNFKKGWNIMYYVDDGKNEGFTTQKPSGVAFKWYF
jgi:hypothetical protein